MNLTSEYRHNQFTVEELNSIEAALILAINCLGNDEFYLIDNLKSVLAKVRFIETLKIDATRDR